MSASIVKYIVINLCTLYIYMIALGRPLSKLNKYTNVILVLFLGLFVGVTEPYFKPFHSIMSVLLFTVLLKFRSKTKISSSVVITLISFGISYAIYILSTIISVMLFYVLLKDTVKDLALVFSIIGGGVQFTLAILLFRSKRIINSFHKVVNENNHIGIYISIFILMVSFSFHLINGVNLLYLIPVFCVLFLSILLIYWHREQITQSYISRAMKKQLDILETTIKEKDSTIDKLRQDNDNLASIIHRDNKIIPAMKLAVERHIESDLRFGELSTSHNLANTLDNLLSERVSAIKLMESHVLSSLITGYVSIDAMLEFMIKRASEENIDILYTVNVDCVNEIISVVDDFNLNTVIADLLENAIIATRGQNNKQIKIDVNKLNKICIISIYDTGVMFSARILQSMGYKKITTHADEGGSGIGMMSTFEIIRKYSASFIIEEYPQGYEFRKKISIVFDGQSSFEIYSYRNNELLRSVTRSDLQILPLQ